MLPCASQDPDYAGKATEPEDTVMDSQKAAFARSASPVQVSHASLYHAQFDRRLYA
jgi:hypothetical protein